MGSPERNSSRNNWLVPVWIMVNYFVWKALQRNDYKQVTNGLADKAIVLMLRDLEVNGSLNEDYHPDSGAALIHKGYITWNLFVLEIID